MLAHIRSHLSFEIYQETRHHYEKATKVTPHEVLILRGGFSDFQAKFKVGDLPRVEEDELNQSLSPRMIPCLLRTGIRTIGTRWQSGTEGQPTKLDIRQGMLL